MKIKIGKTEVWIGSSILKSQAFPALRTACIYEQKIASFIEPIIANPHVLSIPLEGGEQVKTREEKARIENILIQNGFAKDSLIIACGGGAILDLAGFIAATFCRGISLCMVPTTLLAMVDAAIGGKNGVNVGAIKNVIGTVYHPDFAIMDLDSLKTLPSREYACGLAEMLKHAILTGRIKNFEQGEIGAQIKENVEIKWQMIQTDKKRALLNFGHTIGHALEALEQFSLYHGEAVALGMKVEAYIAKNEGYLPDSDYQEICRLVDRLPLERKTVSRYPQEMWQKVLSHDKKNVGNQINFVLLEGIGKPLGVRPVSIERIMKAIEILYGK